MSLFKSGQLIKKTRGSTNIGILAIFNAYLTEMQRMEWPHSKHDCSITLTTAAEGQGGFKSLQGDFFVIDQKMIPGEAVTALSEQWDPVQLDGLEEQEEQREEELV